MNCPNCKQIIPEDITVCPYCGTIIPQPEPQPYAPRSSYASELRQPVYGSQPQQYGFPEQTPFVQNSPQPEPKKSKGASKAVIAIIAVVLVVVIAVVGIFLVSRKDGDTNKKDASTAQVNGKKETEIEKISEIDFGNVTIAKGGLYYKDSSDKYGVMSFDGKKDTGAKYVSVHDEGAYFVVRTDKAKDEDDIDGINAVGLIDGNGKEIIPAEYAVYNVINERYIRVCKATEKTKSKDDALIFLTDSLFNLGTPDKDDILYKGNWYIFDLEEDAFIPDVTGTSGYRCNAYGGCIEYVTDDKEKVTLNGNGEEIPEAARVFDNGYYVIDDEGTVYTDDGDVLFEYDSDSLSLSLKYGEYFTASKSSDSGERVKCVLDQNGKVISSEFKNINCIYGDLVACDGVLYDFDGNKVVDEEFDHFYTDYTGEKYVACVNDEKIVYLKANGKRFAEVSKEDGVEFDSSKLLAYKKFDGEYSYYSFKDKDFTVKGHGLISWYVETKDDDNKKSLVNVMTGKTVLSDYSSYTYSMDDDNVIYVRAWDREANCTDIYMIR